MHSNAYWEGYNAYMNGAWNVNCPYRSEDPEFQDWNDGYWAAAWDD